MPDMDNNNERLNLLKARLKLAKKFCEKPHKTWKKMIREYEIDDISDAGEVREKTRIGYIFRKVESDQPAIFDDQPDLFIKGRHANTKDIEPLIEGTYDYLWDIQDLEEEIEDLGPYFSLLGLAAIESPWVTKTKKVPQTEEVPVLDETGQPVIDPVSGQPVTKQEVKYLDVPVKDQPSAEAVNLFKVYFSPETKFSMILDCDHCPYYFKEKLLSKEKIKAWYGKEVEASETIKVEDLTGDDESEENSEVVKSDMKRVTTYEYYGDLPEDMAKNIKDKDGNIVPWSYDREYHIVITNNEELLVEESPYPMKPMFLIGNYGLANKFWKFGEAKHLLPLVQELQIYRNKILAYTRKMADPKPLIPDSANVDEAAFRDANVGRPVKYSGQTPPTYLSPSQLGKEVEAGIQMAREDLEKTSGSFDLVAGGSTSQVKTPRGIQVYAEAADKSIRRKRKKFARLIRHLIMFQFQLLALNWSPEDNRTISIINGDTGTPEAVEVTKEVLQILGGIGDMYTIDVEIESLSVNRVQMRQDALDLWDLASQAPDIFNRQEVAKWLLQSGFNVKDGDRFLLTDEQRQKLLQAKNEQPKVSVSVRADAGTPSGAAVLESQGVLPQGMAQQAASMTQQQELAAAQVAPVPQGGVFNG